MNGRSIVLCLVLSVQIGVATELLRLANGEPVESPKDWEVRRAELLALVTERLYGNVPPKPDPGHVAVRTLSERLILDGKAVESLSVMLIRHKGQTLPLRFGLVRPVTDQPVPVVIKNDRWLFDYSAMPEGRKRDQAEEQKRLAEFRAVRDHALARGFAICKFVRDDLAIDAKHSRETGVLAMYPDHGWGAIAAWAWGYQPLIDHLIATGRFDPRRIIATGHSRGGKAALAAGIMDSRIAVTAPSASGSGGTGSWEHFTPGGSQQTAAQLADHHAFWFAKELKNVAIAPEFDGHVLQALIAPRGLVNTQGIDDGLANPRGTRLMFEASAPAFELLQARLPAATHWRPGGHGHLLTDWEAMLDYAEAYFKKGPLPSQMNQWPIASLAKPLPDPLVFTDGTRVVTMDDWSRRRAEMKALLLDFQYGHMPPAPKSWRVEVTSQRRVFEGKAMDRRVSLIFGNGGESFTMRVGILVPTRPGRHAVVIKNDAAIGHVTLAERLIDDGIMVVEYLRTDLDPDEPRALGPAQAAYPNHDWGTLAVWAWGGSRVIDYLVTLPEVDPSKLAVFGHSRGGKVALLTGALDERVAVTLPNGSGAGGAGLYRNQTSKAESLALITDPKRFGYWFAPKLRTFAGRENELPFDQHFLRALIAPRAVMSTDAEGDLWANPQGTRDASDAAASVFDFVGARERINTTHFRNGKHDETIEDWQAALAFMKRCFKE